MEKIAIFYGPAGGYTEKVALKLKDALGNDKCDLILARDAGSDELMKYKNLIFGIATIGNETWQSEPVKSGWFRFMPVLEKTDLSGKVIALFGLGDQIRYANHFVDAMGQLYNLLSVKGIDVIGRVDPSEYNFTESDALIGGHFVGLPVDEDFQPELTDDRISRWLEKILPEFK